VKESPRPDVFNENAIVDYFVKQGRNRKDAQITLSCMRLRIPVVNSHLGKEKLVELMSDKSSDLQLVADNWWKHEMPRIVEWAEQLLVEHQTARQQTKLNSKTRN
jgi:hypothetical protein